MELGKMEKLKSFSISNITKKINLPRGSFRNIPDDFLSDNLITKKLILERKNKLQNCHSRVYRYVTEDYNENGGELFQKRNHILYGNFCNMYLLCPICARRRADIIKAKYLDRIKEVSKKHKYRYFVTFTMENEKEFNIAFKKMTSYLKSFRLMGQKRGLGYSGGESAKIKAAIGCGEVKTSKNTGQWHVHYHFLIFCDEKLNYQIYDPEKKKEINNEYQKKYHCEPDKAALKPAVLFNIRHNGSDVPLSKFTMEWYKATNGNAFNVSIIPVPVNADINNISKEVIKYASKVNELSEKHLLELLIWKDKKKFLTTWGGLRKSGDDNEVEKEESLFRVNLFQTYIYDYENRKFTLGSHKDNKILLKLIKKKEQLKEYTAAINKTRAHKDALLNGIREKLYYHVKNHTVKSLQDMKKYKKNVIKNVDSIRKAYKYYIEKLFRYIVDINELRNKRYIPKNLNELDKKYYKIFNNLQLHKETI